MLELTPVKKHKIHLPDYNYRQDIALRTLMADFSPLDVEVLQEIVFSSLKISPKKIARSLGVTEAKLAPIFKKLISAGLLAPEGEVLLVDKELRKYFEFELQRFDTDFKPDMEFLQGLLRKVPIHILPTWYSIPRTSNNIFESIIEKHFLSPQIFQRYLHELHFTDPQPQAVMQAVFGAKNFQISSSDVIAKHNLTRAQFEELMLLLEFSFVCCVRFVREEDHWVEIITPFHEWHQHLAFLQATEAPHIPAAQVRRTHTSDFAFVEELADHLAKLPNKKPPEAVANRLITAKLAWEVKERLTPTESAAVWLEMGLEDRALALYRYPPNPLFSVAEKAIKRVLHAQWVSFDDFLKGVLVPLSEASIMTFQRTGKQWKYTTPVYSDEEKALFRATVFEWLFECGIVALGKAHGKDCFSVTPFGRFFFEE